MSRYSEGIPPKLSLVHWRNRLEPINHRLARQLEEKPDPYAEVRKIGLPTLPYQFFDSPATFLGNSKEYLSELRQQNVQKLFFNLRPKKPGIEKIRQFGLTDQNIVEEITTALDARDHSAYYLLLAEYARAVYGGTIIVNRSGRLVIEMVDGEMGMLATGAETPKYTGEANDRGRMEYNVEDVSLRERMWRTIRVLPVENTDSELAPTRRPGYYEFSWVQREGEEIPRLVFFDYKEGNIFSVPE